MLVALVTQDFAELAKTVEPSPTLQPEPQADSREETTAGNEADTTYEKAEDYDSASDMPDNSGDQMGSPTPRSLLPDLVTPGLSDNIVFDDRELELVAGLDEQISYRTEKSVSRVQTEVGP